MVAEDCTAESFLGKQLVFTKLHVLNVDEKPLKIPNLRHIWNKHD